MAEKPAKLAVTNGKHFVGAMSRLSVKRNQISSFWAIRYEGRVAKNEIQIRCQRYRRLSVDSIYSRRGSRRQYRRRDRERNAREENLIKREPMMEL